MLFNFILVSAGSFVISFCMVALILKISHRMSWYDRIGERKVHTEDVPRLGGLGFTFSFVICSAIIGFRFRDFAIGFQVLPVLLAMVLVSICGVRDDFKPLSPRFKLVLQISAAVCVMASGCVFKRFFFIGRIDFLSFSGWQLLRYPLTFLWIVGITNAVNLIDGIDGLAGGISLLAVLTLTLVFVALGAAGVIPLLCICLASAILGFLVFNLPFPRAKIFMGDGGAYFLGFMLALFPLISPLIGVENTPSLPLPYAAAILLIPILDTTAAVWRRLRDGRRIDSPDQSHIHHKLMNMGLSSRHIDAVLFTLQLGLGLLVYIAIKTPGYCSLGILFLAYAAGIGFFSAVHFLNRRKSKHSEG